MLLQEGLQQVLLQGAQALQPCASGQGLQGVLPQVAQALLPPAPSSGQWLQELQWLQALQPLSASWQAVLQLQLCASLLP